MERLINMYLDYVNKFLTIEKFAEWHGLDTEDAEVIIGMGRKYNERKSSIRQLSR